MKERGFTLTELLVSTFLLSIAIVPIVKYLAETQVLSRRMERATKAVFLAQRRMEKIEAQTLKNFGADRSASNVQLMPGYLCNVTDGQEGPLLKSIKVSVGYDTNGNGILDADEINITLDTKLAKRK